MIGIVSPDGQLDVLSTFVVIIGYLRRYGQVVCTHIAEFPGEQGKRISTLADSASALSSTTVSWRMRKAVHTPTANILCFTT
jgi:hypothetical protein